MRSLLFFIVTIELLSAWNLVISPHGERLQNRRTGDNFLVVCKVKDYDGAASDTKVEWYRNGNLLSRLGNIMTIYKTYSNQLMINRPTISDGGEYICKADVNGEKQEAKADISFTEPPKFVDPKTEQHPEEEKDAQITCNVEGTEHLEVFWQFNGVTLDEGSPRGYEFKNNKQTLVIPTYNSKKDDGIYNCNAAQFSSFETLSINVTGYSRPVITVFDIPANNRGNEGQSSQLKCGAVGKPKPDYKWLNSEGEEIENSDKYKVEDGLLIIESLSEEDTGVYKCIASNPVGNVTKSAHLNVFLKPRIEKLRDFTKQENDAVEIVCKYSGDEITATKFLFGTEEYSVIDINGSDDNIELETGSDETDEETSKKDSDSGIPRALESTTSYGEKTTIAFNGEDLGDTTSEIIDDEEEEDARFKRFENDINSRRISVRGEDNKLILTINRLSLHDAGTYTCVVQNEAGESNKTSNLFITHPPVLRDSSDNQVRSFNGNTVSIFCDVSAVPAPSWSWKRNGEEVEADGSSVVIDSSEGKSKLILQNVDGRNYGKYICLADNGIGTISKTIEVLQVFPPAIPENMDCKKRMYPSYGMCSIPEDFYDDDSGRPLSMEFHVATVDDTLEAGFDWDDVMILTVKYDSDEMTIPRLTPNTQYRVRARAINEAGESELSEPTSMETTDPWAPKKPLNVQMECENTCIVSWEEPDNHGSDITGYHVSIQEIVENQDAHGKEPLGVPFTVDIGSMKKSLELSHIRPHSFYKVSVAAVNAIGTGEYSEIEVETDDSPMSMADGLSTTKLILAVGLGLFFLLFVVDLICYSANRCGVIACFCLNCLGRSPADRKEKDVEAGRGENNRLLENQATSSPRSILLSTPLTTTV